MKTWKVVLWMHITRIWVNTFWLKQKRVTEKIKMKTTLFKYKIKYTETAFERRTLESLIWVKKQKETCDNTSQPSRLLKCNYNKTSFKIASLGNRWVFTILYQLKTVYGHF